MKEFVLALAILLAACSAQPEIAQELNIAISPAAQPASTALLACLPADEKIAITIDPRHPAALDLNEYDFYIRLGEAQEAPTFAAQIASEQIVVIINPDQDINSLTRGQAADLFSGRIETWDAVGGEEQPIELWVGPQSDEARQAFEAAASLGKIYGTAHLVTDPAEILAAVAADSGAAGLLPAAWADDSVQQIDMNITLPVLVIAAQTPAGVAGEVIACLQGSVGQAILAEKYTPLQP